MDSKGKIDIDFEFLEKSAAEANPVESIKVKKNEYKKGKIHKVANLFKLSDGVKKWLTGFIVVAVIGFFISLGDDTSSNNTTPNNSVAPSSHSGDGLIQTGQYRCSQHHHNRAGELELPESEGEALDLKTARLSAEGDGMDSEKIDLENEYVDEYDQGSIDRHNERIDDYNSRLDGYRIRVSAHQSSISNYNARIKTYNNYLIANCTPAY